ncbi:MAG TPA: AI-2E family transporter [Candidatus Dormibacteraeota bacterium]|nr:AI-2E family transporter [Candidatus Dormibacteraeota bacterium]
MSQSQGDRQQSSARTVKWESVPQPVRVLVYVFTALGAIEVYHRADYIFAHVFNVVLLFIFASIITLLLTPAIDRLEHTRLVRGRRGIAVLIVNLVLLVVVGGGIALLVPVVAQQGSEFTKQAPRLYGRALDAMGGFQNTFAQFGISMDLRHGGSSAVGGQLVSNAFRYAQGFISALINILLIAVISIYLESQGRELVASIRRLFGDHKEQVDFFFVATGSTVAAYVRGQLLMALVMAVYTGLALTLVGVHFAFVIAIAVFFLEFLPLIGAPIGMGLAVVFALFQSPFIALLAAIVGVGGHAIEAYIVGPRIAGKATRLHPLAAMAALLIGADVGGLLGALFAVPIAGVINIYLGAMYKASKGDDEAFALPEHRDATIEDLPRLGEEISDVKEEGLEAEPVPHATADKPAPRKRKPRTTAASRKTA